MAVESDTQFRSDFGKVSGPSRRVAAQLAGGVVQAHSSLDHLQICSHFPLRSQTARRRPGAPVPARGPSRRPVSLKLPVYGSREPSTRIAPAAGKLMAGSRISDERSMPEPSSLRSAPGPDHLTPSASLGQVIRPGPAGRAVYDLYRHEPSPLARHGPARGRPRDVARRQGFKGAARAALPLTWRRPSSPFFMLGFSPGHAGKYAPEIMLLNSVTAGRSNAAGGFLPPGGRASR